MEKSRLSILMIHRCLYESISRQTIRRSPFVINEVKIASLKKNRRPQSFFQSTFVFIWNVSLIVTSRDTWRTILWRNSEEFTVTRDMKLILVMTCILNSQASEFCMSCNIWQSRNEYYVLSRDRYEAIFDRDTWVCLELVREIYLVLNLNYNILRATLRVVPVSS